MNVPDLALFRLPGIPLVAPDDDLATHLIDALERAALALQPGDVLAIAQKIVSKAEGRLVYLANVNPSAQAEELAAKTAKDPRVVQLILDESLRVVRTRPGAIIVEHRLGIVLANAGIDRSNLADSEAAALLLPQDPDASARALRGELQHRTGVAPGVLITDSVGRPWRLGTLGIAIGCAGVSGLTDLRGTEDLFGRLMETSEISPADSLAAAATLMMGEGAEGTPAVLVRGWPDAGVDQPASAILRPGNEDLFR